MLTMKASFAIRYATNKVFWFVVRPIRTIYRFFVRPTERGAKVVIVHNGKVLLVRPNYAHRQWTLPGGKVERKETFEEAAVREVREEVGLPIQRLTLIREYQADHRFFKTNVQSFATTVDSDYFVVDGIEIAEAAWFPLDALPAERVPRVDAMLAALPLSEKPQPDI
ncbi:MAG TPA: NUDIX domain-containing protein [Candidatus Paceibacterota bacterium]